jgi:outer membrane lipoprotein-sorting protein
MNRFHRRSILLGVLFGMLAVAGEASARPAGFLRAALEADQRLSYTGVRVVRAASGAQEREQRVRVWHLAPDRTRIEYLSPTSGNLLLEAGGARWFYSRERDRWRSIEWRSTRSQVELLLRNYRVRREGESTVAGRRVIQLVIEPRYSGNPSKRIWIDPTCRMALKEEVRDHQGRLIAASAFEQFELVRDLPATLFQPPAATGPAVEAGGSLPFAPLRPGYLPPGYREVRVSALKRGPGEGVHLRYTDGLGTISLFQFRRSGPQEGEGGAAAPPRRLRPEADGPLPGERPRGRPDTRDDRPRIQREVGGLHCRVMGDVAPEELRKLLDSLPERP